MFPVRQILVTNQIIGSLTMDILCVSINLVLVHQHSTQFRVASKGGPGKRTLLRSEVKCQ